jgi:hypothetical protein
VPSPIRTDSIGFNLLTRFPSSTAVTASPAAASETIIGTLTIPSFADISVVNGIILSGWCAYTVGTSGTAVTLKLRQTNVAGSTIATSGAMTKTAASLYADDINGVDVGAGVGVYVLTMTVTSGAAASTVSAVYLGAVIV